MGEMRGKLVEVIIGTAPPLSRKLSAPLAAGEYKIQLIASGRFFMGVHFLETKDAPLDEKWALLATLEAARSKPATIHVVRGVAPMTSNEVPDTKLHAVIEIEEFTGQTPEMFSRPRAKLTLQNLSEDSYVGLIDPFMGMKWLEGTRPIQWTVRNVDVADTPREVSRSTFDLCCVPLLQSLRRSSVFGWHIMKPKSTA